LSHTTKPNVYLRAQACFLGPSIHSCVRNISLEYDTETTKMLCDCVYTNWLTSWLIASMWSYYGIGYKWQYVFPSWRGGRWKLLYGYLGFV